MALWMNAGPTRTARELVNGTDRFQIKGCKSFIARLSSVAQGWEDDDRKAPVLVGACRAVFDYGTHFPMVIDCGGQYFVNDSKPSVTTAKHITQACYALTDAGFQPTARKVKVSNCGDCYRYTVWSRNGL